MISFARTTARVAAWNLGAFHQIEDERLRVQAKGLALMDAEVIALVEVNPPDALPRLAEMLTDMGSPHEWALLEQPSPVRQHIGVLYKTGVEVGTPAFIVGSNGGDPRRRSAVEMDVKIGKFDFRLIAVHLKSGRRTASQKLRDAQCKVIGDHITALQAASTEDILLMGDFNMIPGQDISNFHHLGGDDLMDFVSSWDLQSRYSHILESGRANLLDGFAMSRRRSGEYIRGSLQLFPMHWALDMGRDKYRREVSDHLPFVASFRMDRER